MRPNLPFSRWPECHYRRRRLTRWQRACDAGVVLGVAVAFWAVLVALMVMNPPPEAAAGERAWAAAREARR